MVATPYLVGGKMGRTVMPLQLCSGRGASKVERVRRSLKKEEQEAFDRLFDRAKFHTHAAVYMAHAWPLETILVSICLEHEKMLREILGELKERNT